MIRPEDIGCQNFSRNIKAHLKRLRRASRRPELLTVNGKAEVVIQSASAYQRLIESPKRSSNVNRREELSESKCGELSTNWTCKN